MCVCVFVHARVFMRTRARVCMCVETRFVSLEKGQVAGESADSVSGALLHVVRSNCVQCLSTLNDSGLQFISGLP